MRSTGTTYFLNISVAGIGVRDVSLIYLFWQMGISNEFPLVINHYQCSHGPCRVLPG